MAKVFAPHTIGNTDLKCQFRHATLGTALIVSSGLFETYVQGNVATYRQTVTEQGTSGFYESEVPTVAVYPADLIYYFEDTVLGIIVAIGSIQFDAAGTEITRLDMTQAVPTSNTAETVGDALNAARVQGFGKWAISGTTLNLYANDGTTVVKALTLAPTGSAPTSRT